MRGKYVGLCTEVVILLIHADVLSDENESRDTLLMQVLGEKKITVNEYLNILLPKLDSRLVFVITILRYAYLASVGSSCQV